MEQDKTPRYTIIIHKIRIDLELSCNEYCVADIIFSLSNNPNSRIQGWCWATRKTIGEFIGISEKGIKEIIKRLIEKGVIEKDEETRYLKTTSLWYNSVVLERLKMRNVQREESSPKRKKAPFEREESSLPQGEESSYYNTNRDNTKDKNKEREAKPLTPSEEAREFFDSEERQEKIIARLIRRGMNKNQTRNEITKFISYWTELNKSGRKQRWEMEKTFQVERRLAAWFSRAKEYQDKKIIQSL